MAYFFGPPCSLLRAFTINDDGADTLSCLLFKISVSDTVLNQSPNSKRDQDWNVHRIGMDLDGQKPERLGHRHALSCTSAFYDSSKSM